ncbi:lipoate--protein ligase family protein [Candidatus Poribacteria bacterium]|nr:lipoate--protein ligase family protein [Candidatus Poribacteria bacterium]
MNTVGRLLIMGKNCADMNMAIDEAILIAQKDKPNPSLRFYDWETPSFSFGYFQDISKEVDVEVCQKEGIELVKRMTGGGTVVHGWDLTYSLILPRHSGEISVSETYQSICNSLVKAFVSLDISVYCFGSKSHVTQPTQNICLTNPAEHDVMHNDKKIAGVSVRRNRNGIMFQGYISLDMPSDRILKHVSKHSDMQKMLMENASAINIEGRYVSRKTLIQAITETFDFGIAFNPDNISFSEMDHAERLVDNKYGTEAWNFN